MSRLLVLSLSACVLLQSATPCLSQSARLLSFAVCLCGRLAAITGFGSCSLLTHGIAKTAASASWNGSCGKDGGRIESPEAASPGGTDCGQSVIGYLRFRTSFRGYLFDFVSTEAISRLVSESALQQTGFGNPALIHICEWDARANRQPVAVG